MDMNIYEKENRNRKYEYKIMKGNSHDMYI